MLYFLRKIFTIFILISLVFLVGCGEKLNKNEKNLNFNNKKMIKLIVKSPYFENNGFIPKEFTCDGQDKFPSLEVENIPETAKSLALIVDDPDAPAKIWVHLVAWNISVSGSKMIIDENTLKEANLGLNDFGNIGWGGPCPPFGDGIHHYHFKIYALNKFLAVDEPLTKEQLLGLLSVPGLVVAEGQLVGLYERQ